MTPWEEQFRLLTTIPGIDRITASTILIEIGPDIEVFASKEHSPPGPGSIQPTTRAAESAAMRAPAGAPGPCAPPWSSARKAQPKPRGASSRPTTAPSRPAAATSAPSSPAHTGWRIIYVVLKNGRPYYDDNANCEALMVKRDAPRWMRMLRRYGYIEPADAELKAA